MCAAGNGLVGGTLGLPLPVMPPRVFTDALADAGSANPPDKEPHPMKELIEQTERLPKKGKGQRS